MRPVRPLRSTVAVACAGLLALSACASDDPAPDVADTPDGSAEPESEPDPEPETDAEDEPDGSDETDEPDADTAGATPDADLVDDPCGPHEGREAEAFIAVAAPVDGQDLGDGTDVELVGCSNVFEANVVWELVGADGDVLADGFTTAECGNGCVGAFEDTLDLSAGASADGAELHVLSPDASGGEGSEIREVIEVTFS